jgi:hypothetical protein
MVLGWRGILQLFKSNVSSSFRLPEESHGRTSSVDQQWEDDVKMQERYHSQLSTCRAAVAERGWRTLRENVPNAHDARLVPKRWKARSRYRCQKHHRRPEQTQTQTQNPHRSRSRKKGAEAVLKQPRPGEPAPQGTREVQLQRRSPTEGEQARAVPMPKH